MRAIQTETGISLGRIRAILETEIEELIGGLDLRNLVKNKLFATPKTHDQPVASPEEEGAQAAEDIAGERPSSAAMRLSKPAFDETMAKERARAQNRAVGMHPPSHSIVNQGRK